MEGSGSPPKVIPPPSQEALARPRRPRRLVRFDDDFPPAANDILPRGDDIIPPASSRAPPTRPIIHNPLVPPSPLAASSSSSEGLSPHDGKKPLLGRIDEGATSSAGMSSEPPGRGEEELHEERQLTETERKAIARAKWKALMRNLTKDAKNWTPAQKRWAKLRENLPKAVRLAREEIAATRDAAILFSSRGGPVGAMAIRSPTMDSRSDDSGFDPVAAARAAGGGRAGLAAAKRTLKEELSRFKPPGGRPLVAMSEMGGPRGRGGFPKSGSVGKGSEADEDKSEKKEKKDDPFPFPRPGNRLGKRGQSVIMCMDPMCNSCPPEMHAHMHNRGAASMMAPKSAPKPAVKRRFTLADLDFDSDDEDDEEEESGGRTVITISMCGYRLKFTQPDWLYLLPPVFNPGNKYVKAWTRALLYILLISFILDPLFLYVLSFSGGWFCVYNKWAFLYTIVGFRSFIDLFTLANMVLYSRMAFKASQKHVRWGWIRNSWGELVKQGELVDDEKAIFYNYCRMFLALDLLCLIPVPQIVYLGILPSLPTIDVASTWNVILRLTVLLQGVPRAMRIRLVVSGSGGHQLFESAWSTFGLNLFAFTMTSHIIGAVWFLLTEQRVAWCLQDVCKKPCKMSFLSCPYNTAPTSKTQNWWVWTKQGNTCLNPGPNTPVDMGIYVNGVQAVSLDNPFQQWMYSIMWGFQQVSTFGGNLVATTAFGEVFFMLLLIALGLFLFALLIGNMQNFLQALGRRAMEHQLQMRDIEKWMGQKTIPKDVQKRVRDLERYKWTVNEGVDEDAIMSTLTEDIQRDVRRHLFLQPIKKCMLLACMSNQVQDAICERLKSRQFIDGTEVIRENVPVSRMFFVLRGALESVTTAKGRTGFFERQVLTKGDFFGEELLVYFIEKYAGESLRRKRRSIRRDIRVTSSILKDALPRSERTVTCLGPVDGFSLEAEDIDYVCTQFYKDMQEDSVQRALNICSVTRRTRAAQTIQVWYRAMLRRRLDIPFDVMLQAVKTRRLGVLIKNASSLDEFPDGLPLSRKSKKDKDRGSNSGSNEFPKAKSRKAKESDAPTSPRAEGVPKAKSRVKRVGWLGSAAGGADDQSGEGQKPGYFNRRLSKAAGGSGALAGFGKTLSMRSSNSSQNEGSERQSSVEIDIDDSV